MAYWAKSNPRQTVWEHTRELLSLWERMLAVYGGHFSEAERELIRLAAYYHDIGKINPHFQADICRSMKGEGGRRLTGAAGIPHGFLSCAYMDVGELEDKYGQDVEWLVMAIFNHHQRQDTYSDAQLTQYIEEFLPGQFCLDGEKTLARDNDYIDYLDDTLRNNGGGAKDFPDADWLRYAVIKGILNRLDYAASGGEAELELAPPPAGVLTQKIQYEWPVLRPVQAYMKERREENLVVLAATGSGKTEAALYWLDGSKCFYTLPLKVSINAIYERIRDQYEYGEDKMTLLHSDLLAYYFTRQDSEKEKEQEGGDDPLSRRSKARLLSYPLTICTADQLFWFVFKAMGSETIPATLKYSRLIIDEIQMYSPDILAYMIYGLKLLTKLGCRFAVLTATFPPVLGDFMRKEGISFTMPHEPFLGAYGRRHKIALCQGDFAYDEIVAAGREQKVLVLCNTVSKAQEAYAALRDCPNCRLLHSRFIRRDRKCLEEAIMAFSKADEPGIWVSTQIVEASLDIDFDLLYTEMCPADSLLQRMGRCYRKRDNKTGDANVYIYHTGNGYGTVYRYKNIFDRSWELLKKYDGDYFLEQDKFGYIEEVYAVDALKDGDYYTQIKKNIDELKKLPPAALDARKAHALFRNIQSVTVLPDIFYQEEQVQQCIAVLREKKNRTLEELVKAENTLMQYTVSVDLRLLHYSKRKVYIDSLPIKEIHWLNIHRATASYEFDGKSARGLCLYEEDDEERMF